MAKKRQGPKQAVKQAQAGDLRPQFNPQALVAWRNLPSNLEELEPILRDRFFELSRPIHDASLGSLPDLRLSDAGRFFYLVEILERLGYARLEETLLMILDEFQQLEPSAYNELYLWSIVQLSRTDLKYVQAFWPQALVLDERFRAADWQRPHGVHLVEQPYRFSELLFYYFVLYTLHIKDAVAEVPADEVAALGSRRKYSSLAVCLSRILNDLTPAQRGLVSDTLLSLGRQFPDTRLYGDAHGWLFKRK